MCVLSIKVHIRKKSGKLNHLTVCKQTFDTKLNELFYIAIFETICSQMNKQCWQEWLELENNVSDEADDWNRVETVRV